MNEPQPSAPATLTDANRDLWHFLEEAAILGGSEYQSAIVGPLQKPLYDRIDELLKGTIQLPAGQGADDIFKKLQPISVNQRPVSYTLSKEALDLVSSAFPDRKIPDALSELFAGQEDFEFARVDLARLLPGASSIASVDAAMGALRDLHDDYILMVARRLLELTNDNATTTNFVELVGGGKRLEGKN